MIEIQCTAEGKPLAAIPQKTVATIQKGTSLFCYDNLTEYHTDVAIKLPEDAELTAINKAIEKKKAKVVFGLSMIDYYDGFMDSKGFEAQARPARKAIKVILKPIYAELADGSLRDAIDEIKALTNASFDGVFVRKSAILKLKNKIEDFLGLPLTQAWND